MRKIISLLPLIALGACTVGPNYAGPTSAEAVTAPNGFVRIGTTTSADAPRLAQWWTSLNDPQLNELESRALAGNPSVQLAEARLRQARAGLRQQRANQLPNASASVSYVHAELPGIDLGSSSSETAGGSDTTALNFYNLGFDASWEIDLFGGGRRQVEAARATAQAAQANVADAQVSLTADVAQAYIALRDVQRRVALADDVIDKQRQMLSLTQQRHRAGTASTLDVERTTAQIEQSAMQRSGLDAERITYLNALAVLTGSAPGALDTQLSASAAVPLPPATVAVGDPGAMLQRRPDVRAAERQLAARTADIGVAEAAKFPRISLMGLIGIGGTEPGDVFDLGNLAVIAAPSLSWSFLDFGRNAARVEQARGTQDEAAAQYRGAVLDALRDAEDALARYSASRDSVANAARARASAQRTAVLTRQRYNAGTATLIDALEAERQRDVADQTLTQSTATMTGYYVAIQKALGLGWQDTSAANP